MSTIHKPLLSLLALAALGGSPQLTQARGPGSNCPDSVTRAPWDVRSMVFTQLAPGTTQLTPATSAATNTDLDGIGGVGVNQTVSWMSAQGLVVARIRQRVYDSATHPEVCSCTYQVEVLASSDLNARVCALQVMQFIYPKNDPLYGAYRTDGHPKGQVKSTSVARSSGKGRNIRFELDRCLQPGEISKPMTLVFQANEILKDGRVRVEAMVPTDYSPLIKVYNPYVP